MRFFLIMCLLALLPCPSARAVDPAPAADTAALVNGAVISRADFRIELDRALRMRKKTATEMDPTALALMKKETLETLIGRELLHQESLRKGIRIQDSAVETEITRLRKQFKSTEEYKASLAQMNLSEETVKSQIERGMAIQTLIDAEFAARTAVTESEAKSYYDSHPDAFLQSGQVTEGQPKDTLSFEAVRNRIIKQLHRERILREVTLFLKSLRDTARVEIHLTGE